MNLALKRAALWFFVVFTFFFWVAAWSHSLKDSPPQVVLLTLTVLGGVGAAIAFFFTLVEERTYERDMQRRERDLNLAERETAVRRREMELRIKETNLRVENGDWPLPPKR